MVTAYSVTSAFESDGICITTSGTAVTLPTPYSVIGNPLDPLLSQKVENSFVDFLGFATCVAPTPLMNISSAALHISSTAASTQLSSLKATTITGSTAASSHTDSGGQALERPARIGIGLAVPVGVLALIGIVAVVWRRKARRQSSTELKPREEKQPDDLQPYLQRKAELEDQERRRHELESNECRYELEGADKGTELPIGKSVNVVRSVPRMQELRGEEHSKELDAPQA